MKPQIPISEQIQALEDELSALDAKRTVLQGKIRKLKSSKQSIADEQLPSDQLPYISLLEYPVVYWGRTTVND